MRTKRRRLAADTPFSPSYYIVQGRQGGSVCLVTGGIHGREIAGISV
ncbi:hypothetical protein [Effusibacillus pohliae]|nr:hypothetical protein [Effusibacillus pohliae]